MLFITHDLCLGYYISDQSVILYKGHIMEKGITEKIYRSPSHPYTQMLMASVPRLDRKWKPDNAQSKSKQPKRIAGCAYVERCPFVSDKCQEKPILAVITQGHWVACWRQFEIK